MNQTARIEMWTCLANDAAGIAQAVAAAGETGDRRTTCAPAKDLGMRMAAARGQARGLDYTRLPYGAWETGREFLRLLEGVIGEDSAPEVRLQHAGDLVVVAGRLVEILATSAHRPRADLD